MTEKVGQLFKSFHDIFLRGYIKYVHGKPHTWGTVSHRYFLILVIEVSDYFYRVSNIDHWYVYHNIDMYAIILYLDLTPQFTMSSKNHKLFFLIFL